MSDEELAEDAENMKYGAENRYDWPERHKAIVYSGCDSMAAYEAWCDENRRVHEARVVRESEE